MFDASLRRKIRCRFRPLIWVTLVGVTSTLAVSAASAMETAAPAIVQNLKGKVVLLDFWASWCVPCRKSFPWMNALQQKYGAQGFTVVAVNVDTEKQLAAEFLQSVPAQFRIEYDPKGALATQLNVAAMPTSFLLDRNGKIVAQHAGFREAQLAAREHEIERLLKE